MGSNSTVKKTTQTDVSALKKNLHHDYITMQIAEQCRVRGRGGLQMNY